MEVTIGLIPEQCDYHKDCTIHILFKFGLYVQASTQQQLMNNRSHGRLG